MKNEMQLKLISVIAKYKGKYQVMVLNAINIVLL